MVKFRLTNVLEYKTNILVLVYSSVKTMKRGMNSFYRPGPRYTKAQVSIIDEELVVFLNKDWLSMSVITHEAVHIGMHVLRSNKKDISLSEGINEIEENIAYVIGEVASLLVSNLVRTGIYK